MIKKDVTTDTLERMSGTIFFKSKQHLIHDLKGPQKSNTTHTFHLSVYHCLVERTYVLPVLYASFPY